MVEADHQATGVVEVGLVGEEVVREAMDPIVEGLVVVVENATDHPAGETGIEAVEVADATQAVVVEEIGTANAIVLAAPIDDTVGAEGDTNFG